MDCFRGRNLYHRRSTQPQNYEDCNKWCRPRSDCAGFTVYFGTCYFKNLQCENNLFVNRGVTTYLFQGKVKKEQK